MPVPTFTAIEFDKDDNPYDDGTGYIEKWQQLSSNFTSLANYVAAVELSVEQTSSALILSVAGDRALAQSAAQQALGSAQVAGEIVNLTEVQNFTTQLARAASVAMTNSTSEGRGIMVPAAENFRIGDGDLTIHVLAAIYEGSAGNIFIQSETSGSNGLLFQLTTEPFRLFARTPNSAGDNWLSHISQSIEDFVGKISLISIAYKRQSPSEAGYLQYFINGQAFGSPFVIQAGSPFYIDTDEPAYIFGSPASRSKSQFLQFTMMNRLQSAAEILDFAINGASPSDLYGDQVPVRELDFSSGLNGATGNFGAVDGNIDSIGGEDDWLRFTVDGTLDSHFARFSGVLLANTKYRLEFKYFIPAGQSNIDGLGANINNGATNATGVLNTVGSVETYSVEFVTGSADSDVRFYAYDGSGTVFQDAGADDVFYIKAGTIKKIGIVLSLSAQDAQSDSGQILDAAHGYHGLLPAIGATIIGGQQSRQRKIESSHEWSVTDELQYLTGVNQPILPGDAAIQYIDIEASDPVTINIGDGSDPDHYVAAQALVAGRNRVELTSSPFCDGTNRKVTVTPAAAFDGSLDITAIYYSSEG
ncbi:hypothetical protein [Pseudohongiella acticola]|uniref:hypothetical protein n=1 Tax=Pseudohongiella acticola TaxID=1524254 RepID=UPI0030EEBF0D